MCHNQTPRWGLRHPKVAEKRARRQQTAAAAANRLRTVGKLCPQIDGALAVRDAIADAAQWTQRVENCFPAVACYSA